MTRFSVRILIGLISATVSALLCTFLFLWLAAGEIYNYSDSYRPEDALEIDVVLCPAGGKGRIAAAAKIWSEIKAQREAKNLSVPVFFLSGMGSHANYQTLNDQNIPVELLNELKQSQVYFEDVSENTFENAKIFSSYARQHQWKKVLLVTSSYHMRRTQYVFNKALENDVLLKTFSVEAPYFDRDHWRHELYSLRVTWIEYLKWLYYHYSY